MPVRLRMSMKGTPDDPYFSVELLEGNAALRDVIDKHIHDQTLALKSAFLVADLGVIVRQQVRWRTKMDQIRPFYTIRSNSSPVVVEILAALGTGFVCSNKHELDLVKDFGVPSQDIILGGTCKQLSHIKYAAKHNIPLLVCDNEVELRKIARCHPKAKVLLLLTSERCCDREETALPFGSTLKDCRHLLERARELSLHVTGVKFNIPSCCQDAQAFSRAVSDARCVFDMAEELGFEMSVLDVGGGFDGSEAQLDEVNQMLKPMLDMYFPLSTGLTIIAEPGAYYVSSAFTLAVNIIAKKTVARDFSGQPHNALSANDEPEFLYYMNDGVYGSFSSKLLCEDSIPMPLAHKEVSAEEPLFSSSLWGPSDDDLDQVLERCLLPELSVGDWLLFSNAGATFSNGEEHNPPVFYSITESDWQELHNCGITLDVRMKNFSLVPCCLQANISEASLSTPA
ncbi:antizyme inhibitor 1a isoform X1 [Carassius auratus]|uniref:Antizyme inhibitor 1-like isoform X1 n=2 Tax=Carassius auratus TaxID=7957 RepID=A0A6P6R0U9_CARAU|nr:antizyme inhibitor 1-like isoform X1 [Carassius auratus]XP_026139132.1 antizyme inhibitor 1-like isoform X1 [Carassius auratus]XP_026139133.1 antizyme inhibitor 1-like isoform X1 [Carassius auratus]XP_026139134.1 antizyme inhibitor 1-like isoform X1 [Carassius auratus]XP_026139135.1 antizyme inhibitor 1-like isoform X1 [Carassius auratus]